ncbi:hypothetical protein BC830DRAFT_1149660 [Chytriomyces sp. MP71]|nr:hypothetical protein BC830DRAFT_1149660 [Chytriomyces sp. MP71]
MSTCNDPVSRWTHAIQDIVDDIVTGATDLNTLHQQSSVAGCLLRGNDLELLWSNGLFAKWFAQAEANSTSLLHILENEVQKAEGSVMARWLRSVTSGDTIETDYTQHWHFCKVTWRIKKIADSDWVLLGKFRAIIESHTPTALLNIWNCDWDYVHKDLGPPSRWPEELLTTVTRVLTSPVPMVAYVGSDFRVLATNDVSERVAGSKLINGIGKPIQDIYSESWHSVEKRLQKVFNSGEAQFVENQAINVNRRGVMETLYLSISSQPIFVTGGRIIGVTSTFFDLTSYVLRSRRFDIVRDLGQSINGSNSLSEFWVRLGWFFAKLRTRDGACSDLPAYCIYSCMQDSAKVVSSNMESIPVGYILNASAPLNLDPINAAVVEAIRTQHRVEVMLDSLQDLKAGCLSTLPIVNEGGVVVAIIAIGANNCLALDDDYRKFVDMLWNEITRAFKFTSSLERQKRHLDELKELDKTRTHFFGTISHEMRTPLTLILGPLESALSIQDLSLEVRSQLNVAFRNGNRLLKFVDNLLDQVDLDVASIEPVFRPTNVSGSTLHIVSGFTHIIESHQLEYRINISPDLGSHECYLDIMIWEKIVMGLLGHAVKVTPSGFISCELKRMGDSFQLIVADSGLDHLLKDEPLSTTHLPDLFKIEELVRLHHGDMHVECITERGTCVSVVLPLGSSSYPHDRILDVKHEMEPENFENNAAAAGAIGLRRELDDTLIGTNAYEAGSISSILELTGQDVVADEGSLVYVVHDNKDLREHCEHVLHEQWRVEGFENGSLALEAVKRSKPSVIVSDIMMPVMNGLRLLRLLRTDENTKDIPVILISSKSSVDVRVSSLQAGADDYLVRPFSNRELVARVKTQLDLAHLRRELLLKVKLQTEQAELHLSVLNDVVMLSPVVFISSESNDIKYCNLKFAELCGYFNAEDLLQDVRIGQFACADVFLLHHQSLVNRHLKKSDIRLRELDHDEFNMQRGDTNIWLEATGTVRCKPDGSLLGTISSFNDVTHRKLLEDERIQTLEANQVAQKKRADEAESLRKQQENFIDMICHEIRNPLSGITNNNDFIRETFSEMKVLIGQHTPNTILLKECLNQGLEYVDNISFCSRHQKTIADQVLKVSKLNMNLVTIDKTIFFEPVDLIIGLADSFAAEFRHKEIDLVIDITDTLKQCKGRFFGDPPRIIQIFINVMANAIKFTMNRPRRQITVSADLAEVRNHKADLNCTLLLSITDTGAGMSEDDTSKLFKRFSQASKTNEYGGSGLGLYISKNLAELMGGGMQVKSILGKGTTFSFYFKATCDTSNIGPDGPNKRKPDEAPEIASQSPTKILKVSPTNDGKFRILVVDDNKINRQILQKHLREHNVVTACDGQEAFNLVTTSVPFDLVLMDLEMPVLNGIEATVKIRAWEIANKKDHIPILAVTGNARPEQIQETISYGVDDVLTKPFQKSGLFAMLRGFLDVKN